MPRKFDRSPAAVERRRRVVKRLEEQLGRGTKPDEEGNLIALEDADRQRIAKEIETLKTRT